MAHVTPPRRRLLLAIGVIFAALGALGTAFSPALLAYAPIVLVALSPLPRHMVLVAPLVSPWAFFPVVLVRRYFISIVGYGIGALYGADTNAWIDARPPRWRAPMRWVVDHFGRYGPVFVALAPEPPTAALAGMTQMRGGRFLVALALGNLAYATGAYWLGRAFEAWIDTGIAWLREHVVEATLVAVVLVGIGQWAQRAIRRRRGQSRPEVLPEA